MTFFDPRSAAAPSAAVIKTVPFNFRVGRWNLFSVRRPLAVIVADTGLPPPGWVPDAAQADGCLIMAAPVPIDPHLLAPRTGWTIRVFREYRRYLVDLTIGYEAYMAKFSAKTRSTLKRKLRKFDELSGGAAIWKQYRTKAELSEFLSLARDLSAKTYQHRLLGTGLPDSASFTAEVLGRAEDGQVRGFILFLEGRPVSYLYLPVRGSRVIYAFLGYDPAYATHSPGTVLQLLAMESLFAEPALTVFDFTQGEGQHKQLFSTHADVCADILFAKRRTTTSFVASAHSLFVRAEAWLSNWTSRVGLKDYLKRRFRRPAATSTDTP
jgi:CelD/BcsL family acetyltransferase involved in cellulose biosynthesis